MRILQLRHGSDLKFSYSQAGEDLLAKRALSNMGIWKPVYLDVGAGHPTRLSNSYLFYTEGRSGVCVEPDPRRCALIKRQRPRDTVVHAGIGVGAGDSAPFYVMSEPSLSTFSKEEAQTVQGEGNFRLLETVTVPLLRLDDLMAKHFPAGPDFLSLDAEGLDLDIIRSLELKRLRPRVICVETVTFSMHARERKAPEIAAYLQGADYHVYADTYINTLFVDSRKWETRMAGAKDQVAAPAGAR